MSITDFTGKNVLITGGSRGIGAASAIMFARAGANVAISYSHNRRSAKSVVEKITSIGQRGIAIRCQVERYSDCKYLAITSERALGSIDILVNNAGIWEEAGIDTMSPAAWNKSVATNLSGTYNMCRAVIPSMKKRRFGRIVNISSTAGQRGEPMHSHYAASKGGIIAFSKSIAVELIACGIRVNCVAPGWVATDMISRVQKSRAMRAVIDDSIPRGRIASPEEIAGPILFLASDLASHVIGEVLNVNGGSVLCG